MVRVRAAHRDYWLSALRQPEWLLIEWPEGDQGARQGLALDPTPEDIGFERLVELAKLRWRIERDYQELERTSGSGTTRGVAGAASTTTPACAWRPMASWLPSAAFSPLKPRFTDATAQGTCATPRASGRAAPPVRPGRHVPHSIASIRRRLTVDLIRALPRCPLLPESSLPGGRRGPGLGLLSAGPHHLG